MEWRARLGGVQQSGTGRMVGAGQALLLPDTPYSLDEKLGHDRPIEVEVPVACVCTAVPFVHFPGGRWRVWWQRHGHGKGTDSFGVHTTSDLW